MPINYSEEILLIPEIKELEESVQYYENYIASLNVVKKKAPKKKKVKT